VPTNIAEGCASEHSGELLQFHNIAYRSLSETEYLVEFAVSIDLLSEGDFKKIQALCKETGRMLNALSTSIKNRKASSKNKN
jgi:four helix bundle protein